MHETCKEFINDLDGSLLSVDLGLFSQVPHVYRTKVCCTNVARSIYDLAIEWKTHLLQQQPRIFIASRTRMDGNVQSL